MDPAQLRIVLDGPLHLRSGQTVTHGLLLTNLTDHDISVRTNGHLTATVVDEAGEPVGGYVGAQQQPLVVITARPSETARVPLLVGTASLAPELGYTVPAGTWHLRSRLDLGEGRQYVTPALELTITE